MCSCTVKKMGLKGAKEGSLKGEEKVKDFRQKVENTREKRGVGKGREERGGVLKTAREMMGSASLC